MDDQGNAVEPAEPNAWKFERFTFDAILLAANVTALKVPRDGQFMPFKDAEGPNSPEGVRKRYQDYWANAAELARGKERPAVEVDPLLADGARELIWALADVNSATQPDLLKPLRLSPDTL